MRVRNVSVAVAALVAGALLAGCAGGAGDGEPTPSPSSPVAPSPSQSLPTPVLPTLPPSIPEISPPSTGRPSELTLTGELIAGVEAGCLLLETDTGQYLLFGELVQELQTGATVTVRGQVRADMMSTCQQGTPFEVTEVLR